MKYAVWVIVAVSIFSVSRWCAGNEVKSPSPPQWKCLGVENQTRITRSERTEEHARTGIGSDSRVDRHVDHWGLYFPGEASVLLGHEADFPCVIEDLDPVVCVNSDLLGVVLGAQIVLPHTLHPGTGRPLTFLVAGPKSTKIGEWEKLAFRDPDGRPNLVEIANRTAKFLRAELGIAIDLREQYVRQLVLYAEGTERALNLRIDGPEWTGNVSYWNRDHLERYETQPGGTGRCGGLDPVNIIGFKLNASSRPAFPTGSRMRNEVGEAVWSSDVNAGFADFRIPSINATLPGAPAVAVPPLSNGFSTSTPPGGLQGQIVQMSGSTPSASGLRSAGGTEGIGGAGPVGMPGAFNTVQPVTPAEDMRIRMSGQSIMIGGKKQIAVRAIEYRGEPLSLLRGLKFNAVWVAGVPTIGLLQESLYEGIYLICSPPSQADLAAMDSVNPSQGTAVIPPLTDPLYDNVLVFNLGSQCLNTETAISGYNRLAKAVRTADRRRARPLICSADSGVRDYSRFVDILLLRRDPMFTSFDLSDLFDWENAILQYLAFPATPSWSTIQTQPDPRMAMQWELFGGTVGASPQVLFEQMQMMVRQAIAAGSHGLVFTSNTPLTANDPETEYRRKALELMNIELMLIEEWFSKGTTTAMIPSSNRSMVSAVLQTNRSRLLLPIWREPQSQNAVGAAFAGNVKYVIPGVPEDYDAFHLIPGGVRPVESERVAGGTQVPLDEANLNSLIFFTSDPDVRGTTEKWSREFGARAAHLSCELAKSQRSAFESTFMQLRRAQQADSIPERDKVPLIGMEEQESLLNMTQESIDLCETLIERRDYASAYLHAEKATRGVRVAARDLWREGTRYDLQPLMTPVSASFPNLPLYIETYNRCIDAQPEANRLPSGSAEDLTRWTNTWTTWKHRIDGVAAEAMLSRDAARSDCFGLEMSVQPSDRATAVPVVETAPIWVTTNPGIPVRMGEMICVSGWINIPKPIQGSRDGVMIFDNLGGDALALRFLKTNGWQRFAFYRVAPSDGPMYLTLSLCGIGKVYLDDLEITGIRFAESPTRQIPAPPTNTPYWQRFNPMQLLPQNWGGMRPAPDQSSGPASIPPADLVPTEPTAPSTAM